MSDAKSDDQLDQTARLAELGLLTASLMHELRQPLFAVKALTQILHAEEGDPRLTVLLEHIGQIEDLVAHYGGFGAAVAEASFDLRVPVAEATRMMRHRADALGAELRVREYASPLRVVGRSSAALQVAVNLIQNALDAVEEGDAGRIVEVRTAAEGHTAVIEVEDTGPGLAKEVRENLGRPFLTTKPPGRGTGLGLYIAQKLVQEHGGELSFPLPERGGTLVRVQLPLESKS